MDIPIYHPCRIPFYSCFSVIICANDKVNCLDGFSGLGLGLGCWLGRNMPKVLYSRKHKWNEKRAACKQTLSQKWFGSDLDYDDVDDESDTRASLFARLRITECVKRLALAHHTENKNLIAKQVQFKVAVQPDRVEQYTSGCSFPSRPPSSHRTRDISGWESFSLLTARYR